MEPFKRAWQRLPAAIRKPLVLIVGTLIIIIGLILVPLPGPGWVVVFAGLVLLSGEFAAAEKLRDWAFLKLKKLTSNVFKKPDNKRKTRPKA